MTNFTIPLVRLVLIAIPVCFALAVLLIILLLL
jgi:hypothetical protein